MWAAEESSVMGGKFSSLSSRFLLGLGLHSACLGEMVSLWLSWDFKTPTAPKILVFSKAEAFLSPTPPPKKQQKQTKKNYTDDSSEDYLYPRVKQGQGTNLWVTALYNAA